MGQNCDVLFSSVYLSNIAPGFLECYLVTPKYLYI